MEINPNVYIMKMVTINSKLLEFKKKSKHSQKPIGEYRLLSKRHKRPKAFRGLHSLVRQ